MNLSHCEKEKEVLQAVRSRQWDEDLHTHAASCPVCAEVVLVTDFLRLEAESGRVEARRPDPGRIWWKAELLKREAALERAMRPLAIAERAASILGGLGVMGMLAWKWQRIPDWLERLRLIEALLNGSLTLLAASLLMVLLFMLFGLYLVWAEE